MESTLTMQRILASITTWTNKNKVNKYSEYQLPYILKWILVKNWNHIFAMERLILVEYEPWTPKKYIRVYAMECELSTKFNSGYMTSKLNQELGVLKAG